VLLGWAASFLLLIPFDVWYYVSQYYNFIPCGTSYVHVTIRTPISLSLKLQKDRVQKLQRPPPSFSKGHTGIPTDFHPLHIYSKTCILGWQVIEWMCRAEDGSRLKFHCANHILDSDILSSIHLHPTHTSVACRVARVSPGRTEIGRPGWGRRESA
jgi:hypothetical protein